MHDPAGRLRSRGDNEGDGGEHGDGGCVDQLSLQELGNVEDDGEEEGGNDEGGQVERGGRGHLRSIFYQYFGFNRYIGHCPPSLSLSLFSYRLIHVQGSLSMLLWQTRMGFQCKVMILKSLMQCNV